MAGGTSVDRVAMAQAAQDVDDSATLIKGLQTRLESHRGDLSAHWEGQANMAFNSVFDRFQQDFNRVIRALEGMHEALVGTKISYDSKEEMSREAANEVMRLLNNG